MKKELEDPECANCGLPRSVHYAKDGSALRLTVRDLKTKQERDCSGFNSGPAQQLGT